MGRLSGLLSLLTFAALTAGCATSQQTQVPMSYHYGSPWVEASVNKFPGYFLLDTGAAVTVVDRDLATRAGFRPSGQQELVGPSGSTTAFTADIDSIELAGYSHRDRQVTVQNLKGFQGPGGRQHCGIIGCDFLQDYNVVFDMNMGTVSLSNQSAPLVDGMLPYRMNLQGGTPIIEVFIPPHTRPLWAKLDTGSGYADERAVYLDMTQHLAELILGDRLQQPPDRVTRVMSITGTTTLGIYRYGPVRILGKMFPEVQIIVRPDASGVFASRDMVLISGSILNQFDRIEMDFPRRSIWVPG